MGEMRGERGLERSLVSRVGVAVEQADRDALHILSLERLDDRGKLVECEREENGTVGAHALAHLQPEPPLDQGLGLWREPQVVEVETAHPSDLEHVGKPRVATSPTRAPRRSTIAFVTTVVPWATDAGNPAGRTAASPFSTPRARFAGVVGTLQARSRPETSRATRSVKVPPTSTPTLLRMSPPRRLPTLARRHAFRVGAFRDRLTGWRHTQSHGLHPEVTLCGPIACFRRSTFTRRGSGCGS